MASTTLEVESKFDIGPDAEPPDLSHVPGITSVDSPVTHELVATYYDTPELDLLRAGITVRRRSGGADAGWHLKLPWREARCELREPYTDGGAVPESFRGIVRGLTRDRDLVAVATLRTIRTAVRLREEGGSVVAEFCDDHVTAQSDPGGRCSSTSWREWEFELSRPNDLLAASGARALRAAGAVPAVVTSKLARVLLPREATGPVASYGPEASLAEVLQAHLNSLVAGTRHLDPIVRADLPDAVHQMRVTARRIRSVLAAYRKEFEPMTTEPVRAELGWLISQLGQARDLEVLCERIRSTSTDQQLVSAWVTDSTRALQREAHRAAVEAMVTARYFRLVDDLDAFAARPPWSDRATRGAEAELTVCLRRQWRRFEEVVGVAARADRGSRGRHLHDVRRAAKRLRYAAEAAVPVLGHRAAVLADALAAVQDVLGHHHDALVAGQFVASTAGQKPSDQLHTEARLVQGRLAVEAKSDEKAFRQLYRSLRRSAEIRWLR